MDSSRNTDVADALRRMVKRHGMTFAELGRRTGRGESARKQLSPGKNLTSETIWDYLGALGADLHDLQDALDGIGDTKKAEKTLDSENVHRISSIDELIAESAGGAMGLREILDRAALRLLREAAEIPLMGRKEDA